MAPIDAKDWRLQSQEEYLKGVALHWATWRMFRKNWDHDHCSFCWAKFSLNEGELHEGYTTHDEYRWVCKQCYEDFKEMFARTIDPPAPASK